MGAGRLADRRVSFATGSVGSRAEELLRRLADDGAEIVDHMCLVGKAAGVGDIRPGRSALAHGQDLFDPCDTCKLLRTRPEDRPEAAQQVPLADVQLRRKPSHGQRGLPSQTLRSMAHDWIRLARAQVEKQKTLDAREPCGAVRRDRSKNSKKCG